MKKEDKLQSLNDTLHKTVKEFCKNNKLIVHKITIEDRQVVFEIWSVKDEIKISNYVFTNL